MRTTLDLPEDLVREIELRALQTGKKLPQAFADLLRSGLQSEASPEVSNAMRLR